MAVADFPRNLRLLCSYGRSVSDVCRRAGINRQQLERYLTGAATPSLRTLRRLSDFFGMEDHEIFLDHAAFAALVRLRPPRLQERQDPIAAFVGSLTDGADAGAVERYLGFYHVYCQPDRNVPEVHRCLTRLGLVEGRLVSRTVERYPHGAAGLPSTVKYRGIAAPRGGKLIVLEQQAGAPAAFCTILDGTDYRGLTYLSGIMLGIAPDGSRTIYCLRVVWHYLGAEVALRRRLAECGQLPLDSPELSVYLRHCITNELAPGEPTFSPRA
ncbi:MAG: helix-turn-helix transcriptional regulator [Dongiaceae bacterium]